MMKAAVVCVLLTCASSRIAIAQKVDSETASMSNGRVWVDIGNKTVKSVYLLGLLDQLKLSGMAAQDAGGDYSAEVSKSWAPGFKVGDYAAVLDVLYAQPENLIIPIPMAVRYYCTVKLKGEQTPAKLDSLLVSLRKALNEVVPAPAAPAKP